MYSPKSKKLLLLLFCIAALFTACRKNTPDLPGTQVTPPVTPPTSIVTPPAAPVLSLSNVLQSNMVIQRDKPCQLWGTAPAGQKVTIKTSWNTTDFTTIAGTDNLWKLSIPAAAANSNAQTITCSTDNLTPIILTNILIGDVWVCSGQSNMVMQMDAIAPFTGVLNYQAEIAAANYPAIRALTVIDDYKTAPITNLTTAANWVSCSPQTAGNLSAVAYYFARKLHTTLNVPVGIIVSAINGSWCESWMNTEAFSAHPELNIYNGSNSSMALYNAMINPLKNLSIKGFIWYQGENNQNIFPVSDYTKLNSALIDGWRYAFNQPELPFYLVQLTPFADDYNNTTPKGGDLTANWLAFFREAQAKVLAVANTGMAITMDIGEADNHHPRNKKPVGERLALLALKKTYSQNVICDGPKFSSYVISGNKVTINFAGSTADGLTTINNQPLNQLFFVSGPDMIFRQGTAAIAGNTILVTAPANLTLPIVAVRYAFTNSAITNIQNGAGLPMEPFRMDSW